jgi:ABC-type amino acid transport substrate-binding protein
MRAFFLSAMAVWMLSAQTASLRLVSTPWPPFTNAPGQPRFALDLVEEALRRIGVTATTTIVSEAEFTASLLSARFDGSAAAWKDAERERALIFSQAYLENRLVLVGRYGAGVSAASFADLGGTRVAIVEGYSYGEAIDRAGPVFVRTRGEEDSLTRLLTGEVDYTLMDELVVRYLVSRHPRESATRLAIGTQPLVMRELYLALARSRPDAASIIERFNAQLRGMLADRTYHRLLHVDWIRGDVDGDGVPEYVPITERLGPTEPQHIYTLFAAPEQETAATPKAGFYLGGTIYSNWASVPESYKEVDPQPPDARRSTASVFSFRW